MTESDKPRGDLEDSDGVSVDADGEAEVDMEMIEMSEGDDTSEDG